jgi:glucosamine kinase
MGKIFYVGIDGGGSKTDIVIKDELGRYIGRYKSGPSNVSVSINIAYDSIYNGLVNAFKEIGITFPDQSKNYKIYAGLGLAGLEDIDAYNKFIEKLTFFDDFIIKSDALVACLGAHNGRDGIIVVIGTGSIAFAIFNNKSYRIGGWGFPCSDEGSGAWIGCEAIKQTLQYYDGRIDKSEMFDEILNLHDNNVDKLISWAARAKSTDYAGLFPIVLKYFNKNDIVAINLINMAAKQIEQLIDSMDKRLGNSSLNIALIGGISKFIAPLLREDLKKRLQAPLLSPAEGALLLVEKYLKDKDFINYNDRW